MISCIDYVSEQKKILKDKINSFDRKPKLCVVQVGNNPASNTYIRNKKKICEELGIICKHIHIEYNYTQEEFEFLIKSYNQNNDVDGIIIQLPIPDKYNVESLQKCISPDKDVDGFRVDSCFKPCTPKGVIDWLKFNNYDFTGKDAVVLGRSKIVGKPLVNMLIDEGCTVTCCNSHTDTFSLRNHLRRANLVISAVGKAKLLNYSSFLSINEYKTEVVVDIGINRDENGILCGDVDPDDFYKFLPETYLTPVPGGVGRLTTYTLCKNVVEAYELHEKG